MAKKKTASKKPAAAPVAMATPLEFEGRVESLTVSGDGPATVQTLFTLAKGKTHFPYVIEASNASRHAAMVSLLSAAFITGTKVRLEARESVNGPPAALKIAIR